ncbi:nucleotide exchange factor GrpE [Segeticoccus rhizosphaerae]|uniref:nucleotide exchange factor GrpE n=1 Tax=Segeticoccus rhizosphaerae TaxID=1104777 RepID=UPI001939375D|nr:nucleotide exchange factor GrpE [Segeticoccus rhizosphaerae]
MSERVPAGGGTARSAQQRSGGAPGEPLVVKDNRRIDPVTGAVRGAGDRPACDSGAAQRTAERAPAPAAGSEAAVAQELKRDLQRVNAEYANYRRRAERDRQLHRDLAVSEVVQALVPVLDDLDAARRHGDLTGGPLAAIADKLEAVLGRFGVQRFGQAGEVFDPAVHEALMHTEAELPEGTEATTVVQVLQPGYRRNDRVVRPARVAVADPN